MKFETKTIHSGIKPDPTTGSIMTPIYQTSTYVQEAPGKHKGFEYSRSQHPTRQTLENNVASLEKGFGAIAFGSGLAAIDAILRPLKPGDEILSTNDLYGGSYRLMRNVFEPLGIQSRFISMDNAEDVRNEIKDNTKLIWIETPTNPTLNLIDIQRVCEIGQEKKIKTCVDNTFASPFLQTPLDLGADLVMHSATKYLGGHSDLVLGLVVCKHSGDFKALKFLQNAVGAVPGPQDCFLALRGIKTLHLRVQRACENARRIAEMLREQPAIHKVLYPGFTDHPNHHIAKKQMRDFGAMVSFDLNEDTVEAANHVLNHTQYFALAESLGGVESLIGHPATMTHASIPRKERLAVGLTDSLIRLSVGIEHHDDLIADLKRALP
ncbi:MAG: aminotransferase class I/II-fold pyridoxal phosphate-dependent enzyme [Bacteroidetes bacterium]|nr:aminotransferase class I/II-fold pyridoxal phosphate-dependent enzyme [Bacteroidota bacterium]